MEVDERVEVRDRVDRILEANLAGGLGPADLPADLVAVVLAQGGEVAFEIGALREDHDRTHVLTLDVQRPVRGDLALAERGGERVRGEVSAAQPPEVDDVPRRGVGSVRAGCCEPLDDRVRDVGQTGG
jgi:hypothetical protein